MKTIVVALIILVVSLDAMPQNLSKTEVLSMKRRNLGTILQGEQVKGYYLLLNQKEKDNYLLNLMDENLQEMGSVNISRPKNYRILAGAFNGEVFAFLWANSEAISYEMVSYDKSLKQLGTSIKNVKPKVFNALPFGAPDSDPLQAYVLPVGHQGFLVYSPREDNGHQFEIERYDNSMKKLWSDKSPDDADVEFASEAFQTSEHIGSLITKKKSPGSRSVEYDLLVHRVADGTRLFRVPLTTKQFGITISNITYDSLIQSIAVFGEYYNKIGQKSGLGLITLLYDLQGKIVGSKLNSWNIIHGLTKADQGENKLDDTPIVFHNTIQTNDGQIFFIGEQCKKGASAGGIVSNLIYYDPSESLTQLNIYNLVIFEFKPDFSISNAHIFEKRKSSFQFPYGSGFDYVSTKFISFYAKSVGGFDYCFSQVAKDKSTFIVNYLSEDKGGEGYVLGSIIYGHGKSFTTTKQVLNSKSKDRFILQAKEGYVLVSEYFKKEKRLECRLERLTN